MVASTARPEVIPSEWHDLTYPGDVWVCPITGIPIPKDPKANFDKRMEWALECEDDEEAQRCMMKLCASSMLLWANMWVWTRQDFTINAETGAQKSNQKSVHTPFISWPVHDAAHAAFRECLANGHSMAVPKSRDMMATWWFLMEATHDLIFNGGKRVVLLSEKKENVVGTSDSMFDRIDYILERLPPWMCPKLRRSNMPAVIENLDNGSSILGVATTENASVSKKALWIGADEAALNRYLGDQWIRWLDVSPCRIAWSSPRGAAEFKRICFSGVRVFPMLYYNHPEKAVGREWRVDDTGQVTGKAGSRFVWSRWLQHQLDPEPEGKGRSRKDLDENVLCNMDAGTSGVFETDVLVRMIDAARAPSGQPVLQGEFVHDIPEGEERDWSLRREEAHKIRFVASPRGRWRLWCSVNGGRPVIGEAGCLVASDISNGLASSNSTVQVADIDSARLIATYADSTIAPFRLARLLAMVGLWFGKASVGGERNGSGEQVIKQLRELEYPRVWSEEMGKDWWFSTPKGKRAALEDLRASWASGSWVYGDVETLTEAGDYVYGTGDQVFPSILRDDKEARATHGDRVMAAAVLWMMLQRAGVSPRLEHKPPVNSLAYRIMEAQRAERAREVFTL